MKIKLFGVRGSIACPGTETIGYGGNTACIYVEGIDSHLIFDAGTGIRLLGEEILQDMRPVYLFFSHYHWDHIQGFPFFKPAYQKDRELYLLSDHLPESPKSILEQMADPHFPVPVEYLKATVQVLPINETGIDIGELTVTTLASNHPGGGCAYRIDSAHGSFAYITDNELFPPQKPTTAYEHWPEFLRNIDLLIHDAMYLEEEREMIHGWGHSLIPQVLQLAVDVRAKNLVLFHHDPSRTDAQLDQIAQDSKEWMKQQQDFQSKVFLAREGDCYYLDSGAVKHAPVSRQ
uniref:Metal-dependent hydrolases of the beta-lactamase superfamily I n=1 Tax=uncultured Thiotrichaceae bacterium TaxID=298394 RepID=A0A6S6TDH7_9GAMM|nr:MAG: Metal-dependent hydrolases of the beta-lactamase superfamily I [uncultured Thiotrichaceae bacterium]